MKRLLSLAFLACCGTANAQYQAHPCTPSRAEIIAAMMRRQAGMPSAMSAGALQDRNERIMRAVRTPAGPHTISVMDLQERNEAAMRAMRPSSMQGKKEDELKVSK